MSPTVITDVFGGALGGGLRLRDLGPRFGDFGLADRELRIRGAFPVLRDVDGAVRVIEHRLGDEALSEQRRGPIVGTPGERGIGPLGFDDVLLELRLGGFERGARRLKVRLGTPKGRHELLFVELHQHVAFVHDAIDIHVHHLDDAVRLRFDLDLRDRLDLARRDDGFHDRAALDRRDPRRIDVRRRALQRGEPGHGGHHDDREPATDEQALSRFFRSSTHADV